MKLLKKKILIFDLDGVIINSKKNMQLSWLKVQKKHSLKKINFEQYFKNIGKPFKIILKNIGIKHNLEKIQKTYSKESIIQIEEIKYYKNTLSALRLLKGNNFSLNIVTSKDKIRTEKFIKNVSKYFTYVECSNDKIKGKPHPDQINLIVSKLGVKKSDCLYIGDTHIDYLTAKNAKIEFMFALWGYGKNYNYKYKCKDIIDLTKKIHIA